MFNIIGIFRSPAAIIAALSGLGFLVGLFILSRLKKKTPAAAKSDKAENKKVAATPTVEVTPLTESPSAGISFEKVPVEAQSDAITPKTSTAVIKIRTAVAKTDGKYPAMAFTGMGITFPRIDIRLGKPLYLDQTIPGHHGAHLLVRETENGEFEAYDPREAKLDNKKSPARCYKATHVYDLIKSLFANKYGLLDKINYFFIGGAMVMMFFVILVVIDKVGK
jgi:hypothetical protein